MTARVLDDGDCSETFPALNGVKQGCVLDLTPFSLMFYYYIILYLEIHQKVACKLILLTEFKLKQCSVQFFTN